MKRYKQLATAGIALSTVGILAGCDHANNTTSGIALTNTANTPGDTSYAYEVV